SVLRPPVSLPMRRGFRFAVLLVLLPLAGCLGSVDGEQLRLCREVLPALHPDGTVVHEIGAAPAPLGRQGVRIDYEAREPGESLRRRFATCGFAGSVFTGRRLDLIAVDTDAGPLAGIAIALTLAAALAALWSWFTGVSIVAPLHARHRLGQPILVATVALSIAIQEFLRLSGGTHEHWFPSLFNQALPLARAGGFVVTVTPMQLIIAVAARGAAAWVLRPMARPRFGREWRSFAGHPAAAPLF